MVDPSDGSAVALSSMRVDETRASNEMRRAEDYLSAAPASNPVDPVETSYRHGSLVGRAAGDRNDDERNSASASGEVGTKPSRTNTISERDPKSGASCSTNSVAHSGRSMVPDTLSRCAEARAVWNDSICSYEAVE